MSQHEVDNEVDDSLNPEDDLQENQDYFIVEKRSKSAIGSKHKRGNSKPQIPNTQKDYAASNDSNNIDKVNYNSVTALSSEMSPAKLNRGL